jgi:hypothetical protein
MLPHFARTVRSKDQQRSHAVPVLPVLLQNYDTPPNTQGQGWPLCSKMAFGAASVVSWAPPALPSGVPTRIGAFGLRVTVEWVTSCGAEGPCNV